MGGRVAVEGRLKPFLKTILGGPSLAALLELEGRLCAVEADLRADEFQVFGSRLAIGEIPDVAEPDLVVPRALMETMVSVLARFECEAGRAEPRRVVRSRGLLMMGRPGTGKTLTIGHILGRLAGCRRYLFVPSAVAELDTPDRPERMADQDCIRWPCVHPLEIGAKRFV